MRLRSASWLFATQVVAAGIGIGSSILLARVLGPAGKGTVSVAMTIAGMGGVVLAIGLPGTAGYLAAKRLIAGRTGAQVAWSAALAITLVTLMITAPFEQAIAQALFREPSAVFVLLGITGIAPTLAVQICSSYLLGIGRAKVMAVVSTASAAAMLLGWAGFAFSGSLSPEVALAWWIVTLLAGAVALTLFVVRRAHLSERLGVIAAIRKGFRFGMSSWISSGLHLLALRADVFLLALLADTAAVGVYSVGVSLAEFAWYVPNALYGVLFPKVAAEGESTQHLVSRISRLIWPFVLFSSVGLAAAAYVLVPLVFGQSFAGSVAVMIALIPGATSASISNVLASYFAGTGRPVYATVAPAANLLTNLLLNVALIPRFGVVGAAIASTVSYSVGAVVMLYYFKSLTHIRLSTLLVPTSDDVREFRKAVAETRARYGLD